MFDLGGLSQSTVRITVVCHDGFVIGLVYDSALLVSVPLFYSFSFLSILNQYKQNSCNPKTITIDSCDCKEQLQLAMAHVQQHGGAVIYLQQEGRGIGLANKVAAYQLQDDLGLDTVDANLHLGFPEDCRHYGAVPSLLQDLRIASIRLMTNNPRKVARLKALGVHVVDTIPIVVHPNPHNVAYLTTKQDRMAHTNFGHILANDDLPLHGISNARQPLPSRSFRNEGMAPRRTSQTHHQQQPQP